ILHIGYFFVPLGFLLGAADTFHLVEDSAGIHAWMVGGAGIMTLAVMTRASLGHTGHALTASAGTQAIYAAIIVAAVTRICAVIYTAQSDLLLHVAALAWAIAFLGFALAYGPMLVRRDPRMRMAA
ncbi:MAG: NnrS family protein, partial [Bradyrhizobium sp.]|nr:NnrS family protein [Bradyrhizobium sp.]